MYDGIRRAAESLDQLVNLESLFLRHGLGVGPEECPHLALAGLSFLHNVTLCDVVPSHLTLPPDAALNLRFHSMHNARDGIWRGFASALQSVHVLDEDCQISKASQLPQYLTGSSGLKSIILILSSIGTNDNNNVAREKIVLSGSFLQVIELVLNCSVDLRIHVPEAHLEWNTVEFVAQDILDIGFARVQDFLECGPRLFCFGYKNLQGLSLLHMCQGMGERGIKIGSEGDDRNGFMLCSVDKWGLARGRVHIRSLCQCCACPYCSNRGRCGPDAQFAWRRLR